MPLPILAGVAAVRRLPWRLIGYAAVALLIVSLFVALKLSQSQNGKLKSQITACTAARQADRTAYESAQREAAANNKAHVAKVEAEQERISNEVSGNLHARLERLRRELHTKTAAAKGAAGGSGSPADDKAAGGADGPAKVCLAPSELLSAAESEERHDQLITWVEKQLLISR